MKLNSFFSLSALNKRIGIDLGTSRIRIWTDQRGFIIDEPTVIAVDPALGKVLAVGQEAEDMAGRVGSHREVSHPIQNGVVVQTDLAQAMLRVFMQKLFASPYFFRPSIMVSVPSHLSGLQKEIVVDLLYSLGAREVLLVDQLLAAAIGAGVPIADASGSFVLQLGSGIAEGGIISLGSLVVSQSNEYAGNYIDKAIERVIRQEAQIQVGTQVGEKLKRELLTFRQDRHRQLQVSGQDIVDSVPKEVMLSSQIFLPLMNKMLQRYVSLARQLFEQIPPELTNDVIDKGMIMSGGMAQIEGLDVALLTALGVPVSVVEEPDRSVIKGIAQILQNLELFKESIGYKE
jgi:rod shape-determining protein MreB and related proteins